MAMSFNDLDVDLQRSVWAAITILALVLGLALVQILNWILMGLCFAASVYMSYKLFLEPKIKASREKKKNG